MILSNFPTMGDKAVKIIEVIENETFSSGSDRWILPADI